MNNENSKNEKDSQDNEKISSNETFSSRRGLGPMYGRGMNRHGPPHRRHGARHRRFGKGRPPIAYSIPIQRKIKQPQCIFSLSSFELEILKLADVEELTQKEIAEKLGISQTSVWRYLKNLRRRIAEHLINHEILEIEIRD